MKMLNELFGLDTGALPQWITSAYQRKSSLGWDKSRIAGILSPLCHSVVMDPGPGLWQGSLIKHATLDTPQKHVQHTRTCTHRESFCQIWINTNTHWLDCGTQLGDLVWASGIFGHLRSPVRAWMQDDSKREAEASGDLSPSMHLSHKQILQSLYSD